MRRLFLALACAALAACPALADTHYVKMLNGNASGAMVFEPAYLEIAPGDTVKFLATQIGHNAATVDGFLPAGAKPFKGRIDQEIEVTLTKPGFYGVKCTPHFDMGMVMLIQVGKEAPSAVIAPQNMPAGAAKRFGEIVDRAQKERTQ